MVTDGFIYRLPKSFRRFKGRFEAAQKALGMTMGLFQRITIHRLLLEAYALSHIAIFAIRRRERRYGRFFFEGLGEDAFGSLTKYTIYNIKEVCTAMRATPYLDMKLSLWLAEETIIMWQDILDDCQLASDARFARNIDLLAEKVALSTEVKS